AKLLDESLDNVEHWGHIIYKAADAGDNITPWHQDEAYWDVNLSYNAIGAWMPLQDVDLTNGCMWFLPGSHKGDVLRHRHYGDDPAVHVLEVTDSVDTATAVAVPLRAGEMTFHHPRILHHAGPNRSNAIRRAWANEFQTPPVERDVPADRPWVLQGIEEMKRRHQQSNR
ncbi:MAG: phytanoyl-CoA dioxygenase family protein, partial [Pseudomonadales bacterium]|nr:phytanoyl-CoA dioxygenase family protein [Pseudomonadales bacterium]